LDQVNPEVQKWMHLIDQARRTPEGELVSSFLEIINQIASKIDSFLSGDLQIQDVKSLFIGITVILYLNERYAIEKVMMFAKGRCQVSVQTPSELIIQLTRTFENKLTTTPIDSWTKTFSTALLFFIKKDFQVVQDTISTSRLRFKELHSNLQLSLLEAILYSFLKPRILPVIQENLDNYQTEFAQSPFSLYFSLLKNHLYEIQEFQHQKGTKLQKLKNLFDNLSKIEDKVK
jgi:hypothetical protein